MAYSGIPLGEWSGSDATKALQKKMEDIAAKSDRQNRWMLVMTGAILILTVLLVVLTVVMMRGD